MRRSGRVAALDRSVRNRCVRVGCSVAVGPVRSVGFARIARIRGALMRRIPNRVRLCVRVSVATSTIGGTVRGRAEGLTVVAAATDREGRGRGKSGEQSDTTPSPYAYYLHVPSPDSAVRRPPFSKARPLCTEPTKAEPDHRLTSSAHSRGISPRRGRRERGARIARIAQARFKSREGHSRRPRRSPARPGSPAWTPARRNPRLRAPAPRRSAPL